MSETAVSEWMCVCARGEAGGSKDTCRSVHSYTAVHGEGRRGEPKPIVRFQGRDEGERERGREGEKVGETERERAGEEGGWGLASFLPVVDKAVPVPHVGDPFRVTDVQRPHVVD